MEIKYVTFYHLSGITMAQRKQWNIKGKKKTEKTFTSFNENGKP